MFTDTLHIEGREDYITDYAGGAHASRLNADGTIDHQSDLPTGEELALLSEWDAQDDLDWALYLRDGMTP